MTTFIYFASVLEDFKLLLFFLSAIGAVGACMSWIVARDGGDRETTRKARNVLVACVSAMLLSCFIPRERTTYMMAGSNAVGKALENPDVQAINDKVLKLIQHKLDGVIAREMGDKK